MICGYPIKIRIYLVLYIENATCDALCDLRFELL